MKISALNSNLFVQSQKQNSQAFAKQNNLTDAGRDVVSFTAKLPIFDPEAVNHMPRKKLTRFLSQLDPVERKEFFKPGGLKEVVEALSKRMSQPKLTEVHSNDLTPLRVSDFTPEEVLEILKNGSEGVINHNIN
jgi:hypothetical protein